MPRIWRLSIVSAIFLAHFAAAGDTRPSMPDAQAWFGAARAWLDAAPAGAPNVAENKALSAIPEPARSMPFSAVAVVLRLDGRPVGEAWRQGPGIDSLATALQSAMQSASQDRRIAALPADMRADLGKRLTLELEFAGEPQPLVGNRLDLLAARVDPGMEGFAIRNGDRWVDALPSQLQTRNQVTHLNFIALTMGREVGLDPAASKDLKLPEGAAAYRLETRRLAQASPTDAPFESLRGAALVPLQSVNRATMRDMARGIARHMQQRWPNVDGLPGDAASGMRSLGPRANYRAATGEWPDPVSPPAEQALAAYAMARLSLADWMPADEREAAARFACQTLDSLRQLASGEVDPATDASAMACIVLAADTLQRAPTNCMEDALRAWLPSIREKLSKWADAQPSPSPTQAAMALAALGDAADARLRAAAWSPDNPERTVMATPWLLDRGMPEAAPAWKGALAQLAAAQIDAAQESGVAPDLDGGWSSGSTVPRPNALSARAAWALATVTQRPDLLDATERATAQQTLRRAMRFLLQLQADAKACHAFRDASKAMGGLRAAPWDTDQPIAASSYALLAAMQAANVLAEADASPRP